MVTYHILIFRKSIHGGGGGGAPTFHIQTNMETKNRTQVKNASYVYPAPLLRPTMYAENRPPIRPLI